jgi:hypothetical protein
MNFNPTKIIKWFTISVWIICALLICNFLFFPIISPDSGFYLSVAREFYEGKTFFVEIGSIYNPLAIVTVGLPFLFDADPNVRYHIAVNILILVFCAFFFYKLIQNFSSKKDWNVLISSFFLLLLLFNDGRYIVLEPLSVLFQLLALNWYLNYAKNPHFWKLILTGIFISLSFLSKQYGLFIVIPIGITLLLSKKNLLKQLFGIAFGFALPLVALYLFLQTKSFSILEFVKCILGKGVHLDIGNGTGLELDLKSTLMFLLLFLVTNLYVILFPFYFKKIMVSKHFVLLIVSLFSSFLVLYFAFYQHYFIYVIPYFLLLFIVLNSNKQSNSFQLKALFLFLVSFGLIVFSATSSFVRKKEVYYAQQKYRNELTKLVPANSNVYLDGVAPSFFYLCHYNSIQSKNVGYCFPGYLFSSTIINNLKKGDYIIVTKQNFKSYIDLIEGYKVSKSKIDNDELFIIQK